MADKSKKEKTEEVKERLRNAYAMAFRFYRKKNRLSCTEVAEALGISQAKLSRLENGQGDISLPEAKIMMNLYRLNPNAIFSEYGGDTFISDIYSKMLTLDEKQIKIVKTLIDAFIDNNLEED